MFSHARADLAKAPTVPPDPSLDPDHEPGPNPDCWALRQVRPPVEFRMLYAELKAVLDGEPAECVLERSESALVRPCHLSARGVALTLTLLSIHTRMFWLGLLL